MAQLFITGFFVLCLECICLITLKGERKILCRDKLSCNSEMLSAASALQNNGHSGCHVLFSLYIPTVLFINKEGDWVE